MAAANSDRSISKQVVLNDVRYDITVTPFTGEIYQASWSCSECHEDGAWAPVSVDPHQAIELAIAGLEAHHGFLHGRDKITRRILR